MSWWSFKRKPISPEKKANYLQFVRLQIYLISGYLDDNNLMKALSSALTASNKASKLKNVELTMAIVELVKSINHESKPDSLISIDHINQIIEKLSKGI